MCSWGLHLSDVVKETRTVKQPQFPPSEVDFEKFGHIGKMASRIYARHAFVTSQTLWSSINDATLSCSGLADADFGPDPALRLDKYCLDKCIKRLSAQWVTPRLVMVLKMQMVSWLTVGHGPLI